MLVYWKWKINNWVKMASCILFNMRRSIRSFSIPPGQPQGNRVRSNSHPPRQNLCPYALPKCRVDGQLFCKGQIQRPLYTLLSSHWPSLRTQTLWNLSSEPSAHESELFKFKRSKNTCAPCTGLLQFFLLCLQVKEKVNIFRSQCCLSQFRPVKPQFYIPFTFFILSTEKWAK